MERLAKSERGRRFLKEVLPMEIILEALNVLAMVSTIAAFILEVWKTWREDKREDAAGKENRG